MNAMNVARVFVALLLVALAWVLGAAIDAWVPALVVILPLMVLAEWLLYVAWKERRA